MPHNYTHALMHIVHTTEPKRAVSLLTDALRARGRLKLLPKMKALLVRESLRAERQPAAELFVAVESGEKSARAASGLQDAPLIIDPTIVGGYQARVGDTMTDASFKKQLQDLYNRATA